MNDLTQSKRHRPEHFPFLSKALLLIISTASLMACSCHKKEAVAQIPGKILSALKSDAINLLTVEAFTDLVTSKEVQLVDVRTPQEYSQGHLIGARNINFHSKGFLDQIQKLDKSRPVAVYCRSGKRSNAAAQQLLHEGFTVADLQGGIMAWQKAGKDIATPPIPQKQ